MESYHHTQTFPALVKLNILKGFYVCQCCGRCCAGRALFCFFFVFLFFFKAEPVQLERNRYLLTQSALLFAELLRVPLTSVLWFITPGTVHFTSFPSLFWLHDLVLCGSVVTLLLLAFSLRSSSGTLASVLGLYKFNERPVSLKQKTSNGPNSNHCPRFYV